MGADKVFAQLAGKAVLWHSVRAFEHCSAVDGIVVVTRPESICAVQECCGEFSKLLHVIEGGKARQNSVRNGLGALPDEASAVAVHDAARPLIDPEMIAECFLQVKTCRAVACAAPVVDTLKKVNAGYCIQEAIDRAGVWAMQTPQVFEVALLRQALDAVSISGQCVTDDTSAVQAQGVAVRLVHNMRMNFKITFPTDLALAECVLASRLKGGSPL